MLTPAHLRIGSERSGEAEILASHSTQLHATTTREGRDALSQSIRTAGTALMGEIGGTMVAVEVIQAGTGKREGSTPIRCAAAAVGRATGRSKAC